jgi:hypothetical protein
MATKTLSISAALSRVETELASVSAGKLSPDATKRIALARDLVGGVQRAFANQQKSAPKPVMPARPSEARRRKLLTHTALGAAAQRERDQKASNNK